MNGQEFGKNAVKWRKVVWDESHTALAAPAGRTGGRSTPGCFQEMRIIPEWHESPAEKASFPWGAACSRTGLGSSYRHWGFAVSRSVLLPWSSLPNRSSAAVTNTFAESEAFWFLFPPIFSCITLQGLDVNTASQTEILHPLLVPSAQAQRNKPSSMGMGSVKGDKEGLQCFNKVSSFFSRLGRGIIRFFEILSTVEKPAPTLLFPLQLMDWGQPHPNL